jgi:Flp pilus assembly protein TadG
MIRHKVPRRRRGTTAVEMAIISAICLAFMFAIFEYGRVVMMQQVMENAARAGARLAVVTPLSYTNATTDTNNVIALVDNQLGGVPLTNIVVTVYLADNNGNNIGAWTTAGFGQNVVVQIDADCPNLFPTGVPTGIPKSGQASVMVNFLPNSSTTTPNAIHLTVKSMMRAEAN